MAGTQPTAPESSGDGPKKKKRKGASAFRRSPLRGYNPAPAWYGWGSAQLDGSPVFLWPDVPRMLRDPQIRFVERMWRAPFQKVKWSVSASNKAVAQFVGAMLRRFWVRSLPKLLSRYFRYGFAPGAAEFAPIRGRVRLVKVRAVEPLDAQARVWNDDHERAGELAGFDVAPHGALAPNQLKGNLTICSPHLFWFAGHGDLTQFHDAPPLSGCFEPWLEKRGRGGAIQSRKLWFRKAAWRGGMMYYPDGTSNAGTAENPQIIDNQDLARQGLDMLEAGGSMTIISDVHPANPSMKKWEYVPPESYSDVAGLREYPQDLDREILVGAGIPPEVLEASEVGSGWSGRMVPLMGYLGTVDELAGLLLEACDSWLGPLVALNFGENAWYEVKPQSLVDELQQQQEGATPGGQQPGLNPSSLFDGKPPAGGPGGPAGGGGDGPQQPGPGGAGGPLSLSVTIPEDLIRKAERAAGAHKYACAYVEVPRELAAQLKTLAYSIPNTDLHDPANGKGRELEPHVTVRFGLLTDEAPDLAPIAADAPPARVAFTGIGHFDGAAEGKPYDVVFASVDSADLRRLNRELAALPHHDTHPEYVPHATIAYVRAGSGAQWARRLTLMASNLTGRDFTAPALVLSGRDGSASEVPFGATAGPRELSWGAGGPLELGWTPYKGPKGGTGWVSDTGEVRYQEGKPGDDEGRAVSPHGRGGDEFDMPEYAHLQRVPGDDHNAIRAEVHKRAVAEGMNPAELHEKASAVLRQMLETRRQKNEPVAAHDLTRRAYETVLNEHVYRKEMEAAGAHFAETYFDDDNPLRRAKKYLKALDNSEFEEDDVPEDVRAAVAEDLATMPAPKLAKLAIRAAFDEERADLYARALEHAGVVAPAPPEPFGPDADPADYSFIPNGELDETQLAVLNAAGRALGGAVNGRWLDPEHDLGGVIVRGDSPLARAVGTGHLADLTDRLSELFQASKSEPMLAVGDVPASARDYGGTSGSKGTGEFRPEEGWHPDAVPVFRRISDHWFVRRREAGGDGDAYQLVPATAIPPLSRLPEPYWRDMTEDADDPAYDDDYTNTDAVLAAQRRAASAAPETRTERQQLGERKAAVDDLRKRSRAAQAQWRAALAGVPEEDWPDEPEWAHEADGGDEQHDTRADHIAALEDRAREYDARHGDEQAAIEAARAHAEEYRATNSKHAEARAKHVAAWNDADARMKGHLSRYQDARAKHAEPDFALNEELAKATDTWRDSIPDTAEDEDAEAALQAVHEALDDIDNGAYPDHAEEPFAAEDYEPDANSELPADEDGTPEELADLAEAAAQARAGQLENLSYEVDSHVTGLPESSRKWRASARADLDRARYEVEAALALPEDVLTADNGRAALEALAAQLDAYGKKLAGEGPRELSATVGPDGGDPNAMVAGQTNRLMRQKKAQLARALAVAMVRVQLGAAESGDPASAAPKLEQLAALAGGAQQQEQPQQQAAPGQMGEGVTPGPLELSAASPFGYCPKCGAKGVARERRPNGNDHCENGCVYPSRDAVNESLELSWEPYIGKRGARAGQQVGWRDSETGQVRYQKSKPGEHAEKRQNRQASEERGREILSRIAGRGATAAEIGELVDHLPVMGTRELRRARIMLDAKFGKSRTHRDMVRALLERVGGLTAADGTRADGTKGETGTAPAKPAGPPQPGEVRTVPTGSLKVDPGRFQFKLGTNKEGVTKELQGVTTFNPEFAGTILAWRDPADGKDYVVNGHHRHELAKRTGHPEMAVRWIAAKDAREARAKGALVNIAEGRGTAVDAAKFMRDAGVSPEELAQHGVSLKGKLAADAATLTKLNDKAFDRLARGGLDLERALAVSKHLSDPARQERLFDLLAKREESGKDLSGRTVEELARQMAAAPKVSKTESTLWGDETTDEDTFVERAELAGYVRAQLAQEANDFGAVASQRRADRVAGAGNTLNVEENAARQSAAEETRSHYDGRAHLKGGVSDALDAGAVKLKTAKSKKERERVRSETLEAVRQAVRGELDALRKPDERSGESGVDQVGGGTGAAERPAPGAEDGARPATEPAGVAGDSPVKRERNPDAPKVEYVRAAAGGQVSEVDGRFYRGGQLMPVHGKYSGMEKPPKGDGVGAASGPASPDSDGGEGSGRASPRLSPQDAAERRAQLEAEEKARTFQSGPLGTLTAINRRTGMPYTGTRGGIGFKPWQEFAQQVGEDRLKRIAESLPPPSDAAAREDYDFQLNHPQDFKATQSKKHARDFPSSAEARFAVQYALENAKTPEDVQKVHDLLTGASAPQPSRASATSPALPNAAGAAGGAAWMPGAQTARKPAESQPAAPQADPFAGATADHGPALAGIQRNNSAYVAGHLVRRMADGRYQIEGGRGFVTGTAEEIADRIRDSWRRQSGERTVALKALDRAAGHADADPFSDPQAADAEAAARERVPDGARAVSLDEATRGRVGVVRRDPETGIARLVFDRGEEGRATDFEPLDARHSWRKPGGQTAPGEKVGPKTGDLFGDAEDEPQAPTPHPWELRERSPENDAAAQAEYKAALRKQEKIEEEGKAAVRGLSNATRTQIGLGRAQEAYEAYQERHRENQKLLQALRSYSGKPAPQPESGSGAAPVQPSAAPDYSKFDALLRTSTDRAQAEQIARATGVPVRPEAAAAPPVKGNYAEWLRGTDPAALKAAAGSPAVDRAELLDAVKAVYGDAVHAEAKKKSKQGIADLLAGAKPVDGAPAAGQNAPAQQGGATVNQTSAGGGGSEPPKVPPVASGAGDGAPLPKLVGGRSLVTGDTFKHKDALKRAGGVFRAGSWVFDKPIPDEVASLPGLRVQSHAEKGRADLLPHVEKLVSVSESRNTPEAAKYRKVLNNLKTWDDAAAWSRLASSPAGLRELVDALAGANNEYTKRQEGGFDPHVHNAIVGFVNAYRAKFGEG